MRPFCAPGSNDRGILFLACLSAILSVILSVILSLRISIHLSECSSISVSAFYLLVCLFVCLFVCLLVCLLVCLFVCQFVCSSTILLTFQSVYLFVYLCTSLSISNLSISLSISFVCPSVPKYLGQVLARLIIRNRARGFEPIHTVCLKKNSFNLKLKGLNLISHEGRLPSVTSLWQQKNGSNYRLGSTNILKKILRSKLFRSEFRTKKDSLRCRNCTEVKRTLFLRAIVRLFVKMRFANSS